MQEGGSRCCAEEQAGVATAMNGSSLMNPIRNQIRIWTPMGAVGQETTKAVRLRTRALEARPWIRASILAAQRVTWQQGTGKTAVFRVPEIRASGIARTGSRCSVRFLAMERHPRYREQLGGAHGLPCGRTLRSLYRPLSQLERYWHFSCLGQPRFQASGLQLCLPE